MTVPSNLVPISISGLPTPPTSPQGADLALIVQNGTTYRTTISAFVGAVATPNTTQIIAGTGLTGGGNLSSNVTLAIGNTGVSSGTYGSSTQVPIFTINSQGQITAASSTTFSVPFSGVTGKPTTLAGYGITDAQPLSNNLTGLAGLGTSGIMVNQTGGSYVTRSIAAGNGLTVSDGNGINGNPTISMPNQSVTPGTYGSASFIPVITVDQQGRIATIGLTPSAAGGTVTQVNTGTGLTGGPITNSGTISIDNTGVTAASYGSSTAIPTFTVNAQGQLTIASTAAVIAPAGTLSGTTLNSTVVSSSLTSVGTIGTGIWQGSTIATAYGGTGITSLGTGVQTALGQAVTGSGSIVLATSPTLVTPTLGAASATSVAMTTGTITTTPSNSNDIANKAYVDAAVSNVNYHAACNYATTADLGAVTYNNGSSGVGATITKTAPFATLAIDGANPSTTQRILVKNESNGAYNGIYTVTSVGSALTGWVLTRATDYDQVGTGVNEIAPGDTTYIVSGTTNAGTQWVQTTDFPITIGTTTINFAQIAGPGSYTAGTGLTLSGTQFSITNTTVTAASYGSSTAIPTFTVNAQGQLTAASTAAVIAPAGTLTGTTLNSTVVSSSLTSVGTIGAGTWQGTIISPTYGGTGINNGSATLTMAGNVTHSGAFTQTFVATGNTSVTLPTSGTLVNTAVTTLSSLSSIGTIATGTWNGTAIGATYGGTGQTTYAIGDILYASSTTALSKLPMGTTGQVLVATTGGSPSWAGVPSTAGVTSISFGSTGLTPATATTGAVTVAGTLAVANGGTGVTSSSGASSVVLRDASANITGNSFLAGFTSTAASGTQITLTAASTPSYVITGSGGQVIQLPNATTLANGTTFSFNNNQSSGAITINNNSATLIKSVASGGYTTVTLLSNATATGSWDTHDQAPTNVSWSTNTLDYAGSITSATWNGVVVATNRGGTGLSTFTAANNAIYSTSSSALTAGTLPVLAGGTGATTIAGAQTNLQVDPAGTAVAMSIALG